MPFTSRPHIKLGVGFAFTPKVPKFDASGHKTFVEVSALPSSDEFSLSAQLKSGVPLKEVNSRLIGTNSIEVPNEKDSNSVSSSVDSAETSEKVEMKSNSVPPKSDKE